MVLFQKLVSVSLSGFLNFIDTSENISKDEKLSTNLPVSFNPSCVALGSLVAHGIQKKAQRWNRRNLRYHMVSHSLKEELYRARSTCM
ncbi:hypothetical protein KIN20_025607 [Parelaphostrongylus tenuis]|uniref:Uncharacterized protein n=1 Tax=Parelaphostrongylus tenuis TaxID=148309 RepID=A0AAD5QXB3_PARTN|nr:hypothetical protein KIN20_025607 [Parelaphostrongylus tenuis]